jgi:uncharacterized protein YbjT (DUF2867 family)
MIVVAGGSGLLGRHVVSALSRAGEEVRVLVRDPAKAHDILGHDVDIAAADVRRPDEVSRLVAGASVVVSALHGFLGGRGAGPAEVDGRGNAHLADAAKAIGADMVLVSVLEASRNSEIDLFRAKAEAERYLQESGTPWTVVRSGPFLETWLDVLSRTAGRSHRPIVFGSGRQPIGFVSAVDVAALVALAATDRTLRGQTLEISGTPMTMNELAAALQEARRSRGHPRHIPPPVLRLLATVTRPVSPAFARKNRTALHMDTWPYRPGNAASTPQLPRRALVDVLAAPPP